MGRPAKVKPVEYVEGDELVTTVVTEIDNRGFELMKPAPADRYWDYDTQTITDEPCVRANVIVRKGDEVTPYIATQLGL